MRTSIEGGRGFFKRAAVSGSAAGALVVLGLALFARREGKHPLQPVNATSHWLHGKRAARIRRADLKHTLVGYLTHHASAVFWGLLFEWLLGRGRPTAKRIITASISTVAIAGATDYGLVPKRLTPGWEDVVSPRAVATSFAVMAFGFALAASLGNRGARRRSAIR